jgi:hypothetical protein
MVIAASTAFSRRHAMRLVLVACVLGQGGAAMPVEASGEQFKEGKKPMAAKPKSAVTQISFDDAELVALLPVSLGEWTLATMERPMRTPYSGPMLPVLRAEYSRGKQSVEVALSTRLPASVNEGTQSIFRDRDETQQVSSAILKLHNGLTITASSHLADAEALEKLINSIDLPRARKLKPLRK